MKTKVIMMRHTGLNEIAQDSKTGFFNAKDIMTWVNMHREADGVTTRMIASYWELDQTEEFMRELALHENVQVEDLKKTKRGKYGGTWVHPYVAIDMAMWGYAKLKIRVIEWVHDSLLSFRNESGNSFIGMNKALDTAFGIGGRRWKYVAFAEAVALACGVGKGEDRWQVATEAQLELRNEIQKAVEMVAYLRTEKSSMGAVNKAIKYVKENKTDAVS